MKELGTGEEQGEADCLPAQHEQGQEPPRADGDQATRGLGNPGDKAAFYSRRSGNT